MCIVTSSDHGETFHLDLVNSKTRWVILAMTNVLITVILPNSVIFLLDETFNSFSISLSLFFIVDQHSFMYIGRKYHTQHFKCCRVPMQIQFWYKFYMWAFLQMSVLANLSTQKSCSSQTVVMYIYMHKTILVCHQEKSCVISRLW